MKMPRNQVIKMIAVGYGFMPTVGTVYMIAIMVGAVMIRGANIRVSITDF
jgi:hypothetical protein